MVPYLRKVFGQIAEFLGGLSAGKKVAMGVTAVFIGAVLVTLFLWAGNTTYQPLMTNVNPEDSAAVIRLLREKRIPFKVDDGGKTISIPKESIYEFRLELATMGMSQGNVTGYEVFDKQSLGTTSFVHKINQKRALEGELMRTINTISGVKRSRVHLAIPQKSTFVEDQKKSSASVVLDLEPGTVLNEKQVYGIGNLVARAVEGMDIADVVIVDATGKTLSKNTSDPLAAATATQLDFKTKFEQETERKVEAMLARVVGEGRVVARVNADFDFSNVNETQTLYDSDGSAVRSTHEDVKSMEGSRPGPTGLAGAASNLPGQPPAVNSQVKSDTKTSSKVVNYEVPQTIRRTQKASGTIKKLSVAVVVDGKAVKIPAKDGAAAQSKTEAWSAEKLAEFESIVATAVGIDRKRGDTVEVKNMEFSREDFAEAERVIAENERRSYIQNMLIYSVIGLTIIFFFLLVVRPFIKWVTENTIDSVDTFLPQTIEELERMQKSSALPQLEEIVPVLPEKVDPEKVEGEMIKEKIVTLVDSNPHKAALILRDWLHGDGKKKGDKDAVGGKDPKESKGKSA